MSKKKDDDVTATIEPDDVKTDMWMVVFRDSDKRVIGIPLREVDRNTALNCESSLRYAFEFGARHARDVAIKAMNRCWWTVRGGRDADLP